MHLEGVWFVKNVFFTGGAFSFFGSFLMAACFPGIEATH
jgi:hypothetical protein